MTIIKQLGTVLGIWAHPDDEGEMAGIMAAAVQAGQKVACVTATRGELGTTDESKWPTSSLGQVRQRELESSLKILGVQNHYWLGYPDGGCSDIKTTDAVSRISDLIREIRPDSVFTFGPEGLTGHDDHRAVSRWALAAFRQTAKTGAKLYYDSITLSWLREFGQLARQFNIFFNIPKPPVTVESDLAINFQLTPQLQELKHRALTAHASQYEAMFLAAGEDVIRRLARAEYFRLGQVK